MREETPMLKEVWQKSDYHLIYDNEYKINVANFT